LPEGVVIGEAWAHDRVLSGFQHALAAVLPSEWPDPCPTTVLEAMAVGAPLVTTHLGGIADMVRAGESALVTRPGDVDDLEAALRRVASDEALREHLRRGARDDVRGFLESAVAAKLEGLYASLCR
jgi:glycosyltransferase involved in cell wall biosynthesis